MKCSALNRGNAFGNQLFTAIDQTSPFSTIFFGTTRNGIVIVFVWLSQVCSICIRDCTLFTHPQQRGAGIQPTRKSNTNTLAYREMLENRRHKIKPC